MADSSSLFDHDLVAQSEVRADFNLLFISSRLHIICEVQLAELLAIKSVS